MVYLRVGILGYSIDKEYEGKGYMKEAINLVLNYAKEYLDLHRLEASVLTTNERSKGVLLALVLKRWVLIKSIYI